MEGSAGDTTNLLDVGAPVADDNRSQPPRQQNLDSERTLCCCLSCRVASRHLGQHTLKGLSHLGAGCSSNSQCLVSRPVLSCLEPKGKRSPCALLNLGQCRRRKLACGNGARQEKLETAARGGPRLGRLAGSLYRAISSAHDRLQALLPARRRGSTHRAPIPGSTWYCTSCHRRSTGSTCALGISPPLTTKFRPGPKRNWNWRRSTMARSAAWPTAGPAASPGLTYLTAAFSGTCSATSSTVITPSTRYWRPRSRVCWGRRWSDTFAPAAPWQRRPLLGIKLKWVPGQRWWTTVEIAIFPGRASPFRRPRGSAARTSRRGQSLPRKASCPSSLSLRSPLARLRTTRATSAPEVLPGISPGTPRASRGSLSERWGEAGRSASARRRASIASASLTTD
mmetsp:Transcript_67472/g.121586  ORF Transcript_67472/g.121586 Transcript_67472/m.121586 type:complete len:396 (+) Transcript_67472:1081-2268(+)